MAAANVTVEWVVPAAAACPARAQVEAKVASLLRPGASDVSAHVTVVSDAGDAGDAGAGVHVDIERAGVHRTFDAPSCAEAADAAALILALGDGSAPIAAPPAPAPPAPVAAPAPPATPPVAPVAPVASRISARAFFDTGSLAEPALGVTVGASRDVARLELGAALAFAAGVGGASDASGNGGTFDRVTAGLEAFLPVHAGSFTAGPVLGAEAGVLVARGTGVDVPATKVAGAVAVLAAGRARWDVSERFALALDLDIAVPFDRPSFYFSPSSTDFARVAPVSFRAALGPSVRF